MTIFNIRSPPRTGKVGRKSNQRGLSLIVVVGMMMILSALGLGVVSMSGTFHREGARTASSDGATYAAQAGLEWAMKQIVDGNPWPSTPPTGLGLSGNAWFRVQRGADGTTVATGLQGDSTTVLTTTSPRMRDCISMDTSNFGRLAPNLFYGVFVQNTCPPWRPTAVVDGVIFSWDPAFPTESLTSLDFGDQHPVYKDAAGTQSNGFINFAVDESLSAGVRKEFSKILFLTPMFNKSFTLTLVMQDSSRTAPVSFRPKNE